MLDILLVDDEPEILESLRDTLLEHFGQFYNIMTTPYSSDAMEIIKTNEIDILITDIKMPEFTGFDLAKVAREFNPDTRIVLLTSFSDFDYAHNAIKIGCDDYILKTCTDKELIDSIKKLTSSENAAGEHDENLMERVTTHVEAYIMEHLAEDLSLQNLSDAVYYNPNYLARLFKKHTGKSLTDFILSARINKAKELLQETRLKIYEIASQVGFENTIYFNRVFKKKAGLTPTMYRRKWKR